jgi:hypothetical protein
MLFIVLLVFLIWWGQRPFYQRKVMPREFEKFLRVFLTDCVDDSFLFVRHENSKRFVQFAKRGQNEGQVFLHFGFPDAPWSREYFDPMAQMFQTMGIDFNIVTTGDDMVRRFLEITLVNEDLDVEISRGAHIARVAFEVMGLSESETFKVNFEAKLKTEAARPALEALRDAPNKLVRRFSRHYLKKLNGKKK